MPVVPIMPEPVLPRPYPEHLFTDFDWRTLPAQWVRTDTLVPSQDDVSLYHLARLHNGGEPESGDPAAWVVEHDGIRHIHNGNHRWTLAFLRGDRWFLVRIATVSRSDRREAGTGR